MPWKDKLDEEAGNIMRTVTVHHQVTGHNEDSGLTLMSSVLTDEEHRVRKLGFAKI